MIRISKIYLSIILFFACFYEGHGQFNKTSVLSGSVIDSVTSEPVPFASVTLYSGVDTSFYSGGVCSAEGDFQLSGILPGQYLLNFTAVGYNELYAGIEMSVDSHSVGILRLQPSETYLSGIVVSGERIKASAETDRTVYFVNKKMLEASHTGLDILKLLPGVSIDLMQNISVEGNNAVIILVNGMERDGNYIRQLQASDIDKIEIMANPPARYEGSAARVMNVITRKNKSRGVGGHVYIEAPTGANEIYSHPTAKLSYSGAKTEAFVSYDAALGYFNIRESSVRRFNVGDQQNEVTATQDVRQKNWSQRFHYGLDFRPDQKNQFSFYGYYNPYSQEHDGSASMLSQTSDWNVTKEDDNRNYGSFNSLFYKRILGEKPGHELTLDAGLYHLTGTNSTVFTDDDGTKYTNLILPRQNSSSVRLDYSLPLANGFGFSAGFQSKTYSMKDRNTEEFGYGSRIYAGYGGFRFSKKKIEADAAVRVEQARFGLTKESAIDFFRALPNVNLSFLPSEKERIRFNYRGSLGYPGFYQLNPYSILEDPLSTRTGNPYLNPVQIMDAGLEYSRSVGSNWMALRPFVNRQKDVINELVERAGTEGIHSRQFNLGTIYQYGLQFTGSFSLGKSVALQGYVKGFNVLSRGNELAVQAGIRDNAKWAIETAASIHASLSHGFSLAGQFTYTSRVIQIQRTVFKDPLYFVSLEKAFGQSIKTGINVALPFAPEFSYRGYEIESENFTNRLEGVINLSVLIPVFLKFSYVFNEKSSRNRSGKGIEDIGVKSDKGF
jgi:hypothetical protein